MAVCKICKKEVKRVFFMNFCDKCYKNELKKIVQSQIVYEDVTNHKK